MTPRSVPALEYISTEKAKGEALVTRTIERISNNSNLEEVFQTTIDELRELLAASRCLIYELDTNGKYLIPRFESIDNGVQTVQYARLPVEASPINTQVLISGETAYVEDLSPYLDHPVYKSIKHLVPCAVLSVPLRARGRIVAGISLHECKAPRRWLPEEIELVTAIADQIGLALQNAQLFQEVQDRTRELKDTISKLEELGRQREEFTTVLVHDIRSPLSAVLGILELLEVKAERSNLLDESIRRLIDNGKDTLNGIVTLVNEILDFSKAETGGMQLELTPITVEKLLEISQKHVEIFARQKDINLHTIIEPDLPILNVDIQKLLRSLDNLLDNAIKFTQPNGIIYIEAKRVSGIDFDRGKQFVVISIVDDGPGIPATDLPYLFNPYYQAKQRSNQFGIGLGLAIVKRILAAHGGNVAVQSTENVGSAFSLILPIS